MDIEIEAKFTDINPEEFRKKLTEAGAVLVHPEILMKRKVYEHPTNKQNDWFRVRDEGGKITMSYKKLNDRTLYGTQEISYTVPDFDQACRFLEATQLKFVSYQETKREAWKLGGAEITIDTWPWIPTFVEIEAGSEEEIKKACTALGLDIANAIHGSVENVYIQHYDVTEEEVDNWPEATFVPVPLWLESKRLKK
ncbi:MAG: CYTH domain-containing protein [Candidatus Paceibacterota bacterium]|jgi:adenylate cyclase class 2